MRIISTYAGHESNISLYVDGKITIIELDKLFGEKYLALGKMSAVEQSEILELALETAGVDNNFDLWIEPLKFIKESTNFILTLIRKSGNFQDKNAEKGFYIQKLDQNKNIQLVRITLSSDVYYYPQISVGKQRINIMFMTKDEANNLVQYQEDVPFLLTICCL